jgi:hypothetical protein
VLRYWPTRRAPNRGYTAASGCEYRLSQWRNGIACHTQIQFGKGCLVVFFADKINSGTRFRRSYNFSDKTRNASRSSSYQAEGICSSVEPSVLSFTRLQPLHPRSKRFLPAHSTIYVIAGVQSPQRSVRKIPLPRVKAESLIDHHGAIARSGLLRFLCLLSVKQGLPAVGIARPFIKY